MKYGDPMGIRGDGFKEGTLRRWLAHLLLLAFALRALIPAGYMPDFTVAAHGAFKVVICSAASSSPIQVDLLDGSGSPTDQTEKHSKHASDICAFTGIAAIALPDLQIEPLLLLEFAAIALTYPLAVTLPPVRAGPALGARAPPRFS